MHIAAIKGNYKIVKLLLIYGASPYVRTFKSNYSPFDYAAESNQIKVVNLLKPLMETERGNSPNNPSFNEAKGFRSTKTSLESSLNTKAGQLVSAINNNIPTPAPILAEPIIEGTTVTIAPELPVGYTANTWYYQVVTDDPNAENPYAGGTYNTDGAPESIQLTGLTEGATYTIRVANWSGPVSDYTETVISIPTTQSSNLTGGSSYVPVDNNEQTPPDDTSPDEGENTETEPTPEDPVDETPSEEPESPDTDTPESDESSSSDEQDNIPEENVEIP